VRELIQDVEHGVSIVPIEMSVSMPRLRLARAARAPDVTAAGFQAKVRPFEISVRHKTPKVSQ
jgi:hypothetical protein